MSTANATWPEVVKIAKKNDALLAAILANGDDQYFIDFVAMIFKSSDYGEMTSYIQAYAIAHFALMSNQNETAGLGPKSSEQVGDTSISYTLPVLNTKEAFGETQYGRHMKKLMAAFGPPSFVVTNG